MLNVMSQENNTVLYVEILFISCKQNLLTRVVQTWTYAKSFRAQWTIKSFVHLRVVIPHALSVNLDCNRRHASHVQQAVIFLCNDKRWKIPRDTSLRLNEDKLIMLPRSRMLDDKLILKEWHIVPLLLCSEQTPVPRKNIDFEINAEVI